MKKSILLLVLITFHLSPFTFIGTPLHAHDFSVTSGGQTLYFLRTGSNTASVTYPGSYSGYSGYTKPTGSLVIPATVANGGTTYTVTAVNQNAFSGCNGLTSVQLPNSVTRIGSCAFYCCSSLTSVTLPNALRSIANSAFDGCTALTVADLPATLKAIGNSAFSQTALITVTIPASVDSIGERAFASNASLATVNFNAVHCVYAGGSTTASYCPFYQCPSLTEFNFGEGVTHIVAEGLMSGISTVQTLTIPESVTAISRKSFYNCSGITTLNYNAVGCTAILNPKVETSTYDGFTYPYTVNFGENVRTIPAHLLCGNSHIVALTFPDKVTHVGAAAFVNCDHLTNITFGRSMVDVGDSAFFQCTQIVHMVARSQVAPTAYAFTFENVSSAGSLEVPCGALDSYNNAAWWFRFSPVEKFLYDFDVTSSDPTRGSVSIVAPPTCDHREAEIKANPYHNYRFHHWSDGDTTNPRFIVVLTDTAVVAHFCPADSAVGISEAQRSPVNIIARDGSIIVEGAVNHQVHIYTTDGRLVASSSRVARFPRGVYLVKIGDATPRKVILY